MLPTGGEAGVRSDGMPSRFSSCSPNESARARAACLPGISVLSCV